MKDDSIKITGDLDIRFDDLMRSVDFSQEFTLRDVLRAAVSSTEIPVEIMSAILRCSYISEFWQECESKQFSQKDDRDLEYLELYWIGDRQEWEGKVETSSMWSFHGVGKKGVIPEDMIENNIPVPDAENYRQAFAVEFSPMYTLKNLPVRLCRTTYITDYKDLDKDLELEFSPTITLVELFHWIFWELSFCGGTKDRDDKMKEIQDSYEESKVAIADGTWKQKFKQFNTETGEFESIKDGETWGKPDQEGQK
jgi:hypothetical protein